MFSAVNKLLLIEDDPFLIEWEERLLQEHFPGLELVKVLSEREFLVRKDELADASFQVILLDIMLPWEDGADMGSTLFPEPRGTFFEAGIRILRDIAETPKLASIPILVQTVNDRSAVDIPRDTKLQISFRRKDEPDDHLIHWIRRHI